MYFQQKQQMLPDARQHFWQIEKNMITRSTQREQTSAMPSFKSMKQSNLGCMEGEKKKFLDPNEGC